MSFSYNNDASSTVRYGFVAEDTAAVDSHLGTYNVNGNLSGVDDRALLAVVVDALQELIQKVESFAQSFTTHHLTSDDICLKKSDGTQVCVTGDQLAAIAGASTSDQTSGKSSARTNETTDTEPSVITINGNNPAVVNVGDTYIDLGASVSDNVDQNLGIKAFVGTTSIELASIDTSEPKTYHIYYVATDNTGNTFTSTRTVMIKSTIATAYGQSWAALNQGSGRNVCLGSTQTPGVNTLMPQQPQQNFMLPNWGTPGLGGRASFNPQQVKSPLPFYDCEPNAYSFPYRADGNRLDKMSTIYDCKMPYMDEDRLRADILRGECQERLSPFFQSQPLAKVVRQPTLDRSVTAIQAVMVLLMVPMARNACSRSIRLG